MKHLSSLCCWCYRRFYSNTMVFCQLYWLYIYRSFNCFRFTFKLWIEYQMPTICQIYGSLYVSLFFLGISFLSIIIITWLILLLGQLDAPTLTVQLFSLFSSNTILSDYNSSQSMILIMRVFIVLSSILLRWSILLK